MHREILPNLKATYSFAALKDSDISAHLRETQVLLTETGQLGQRPLRWLLWPSCPFQPQVPAWTFLKPSEMTGPRDVQEQFGMGLISIPLAQLRCCGWEGEVGSVVWAGASVTDTA